MTYFADHTPEALLQKKIGMRAPGRRVRALLLTVLLSGLSGLSAHPAGAQAARSPRVQGAERSQVPRLQAAEIPLPANGMAYEPKSRKLYVTVGDSADLSRANSLTVLDPFTGAVGKSFFIGGAPGAVCVSAEGRYLYIAVNDSHSIRRFDIAAQTLSDPFEVSSSDSIGQMFPMPQDPSRSSCAA